MTDTIEQLTYSVPGMSCGHCRAAIIAEVHDLSGIDVGRSPSGRAD